MKDITHYFVDLPKKGESASATTVKEVSVERAKIDDDVAVAAVGTAAAAAVVGTTPGQEDESRTRKKRGRVKIKISRNVAGEGEAATAVCKIIQNPTDLVDKTPSPCVKKSKKRTIEFEDGSSNKRKKKDSSDVVVCEEANGQQDCQQSKKKKQKKSLKVESKKIANEVIPDKTTSVSTNTDLSNVELTKNKTDKSVDAKSIKNKQTEKLIELANAKGYSKRKIKEEEEAAKMEKRIEKRKKMFTVDPDKSSETNSSIENTPNNNINNSKRTSNLLNYFSKSTPEQLEKERYMNAKVTVKAEIHILQDLPIPKMPVCDKKTKNLQKKKTKSNSKQMQEDADEIRLIQSETLILSPKNEKNSPSTNKPKWSLKIQLQSNGIDKCNSDEEIYTPTLPSKLQKENIKNDDKIPKVLLPIKNKKSESNSLTNTCVNNHKEEKVTTNNVSQKSKTEKEKLKTETKKNINNSNKKVDVIKTSDKVLKDKSTDDECLIIEEKFMKKEQTEKLAPLFKKKAKPKPEVIAARRLFLQSNMQENGISSKKQKPPPAGPFMLPFPKISHVNQLSPDYHKKDIKCNFLLKTNKGIKKSYNISHMKSVLSANDKNRSSENLYECVKSDIATVLSEVESYCPEASNLWKSIQSVSKSESSKKTPRTKRRSDRRNSKQFDKNIGSECLISSWTDKYKPNSSTEIVGNEEAAFKLKSWLETWQSSKNREGYSSGEEFYTSDCSMSSNSNNNQIAVLIGPHGSGKTACVYAVAQELGYKVLEVNASSKRPGKKILKDFEEATKSHRVKKTNLESMLTSVPKKVEESKKISQNSLILMEDIDLVFEEDEGFVSAAFQLASNTKRPIVMTLKDTCFHLSKMAPQQLFINFKPVVGKKVTALLQLIALAETECKLSQNCIDALCENGDLRKSLLQLQYLLLSVKERISLPSLALNALSWKDMENNIYKPAIKADKKQKKVSTNENLNNSALNNLTNNLDNFSLISMLSNIEDPTLCLMHLKFEPNISFVENTECFSSLESTSLEIGTWLNDSMKKLSWNHSNKSNSQNWVNISQLSAKKEEINRTNSALAQMTSNTLDRRALAVDYLSSIRTICRAEEIRYQLNSKRGNRFFHYLQHTRLSSAMTKSSNTLFTACRMLQEKSTPVV